MSEFSVHSQFAPLFHEQDGNGVSPLKENGQLHSDSRRKSKILNNQFCSVFTSEDTTNIPKLQTGELLVPCPLRNLPLRITKNNRPTSSYHLHLPVRTTSIPTTSYPPLRTRHFVPLFLNVLCREMESIRNLIIQYFYCIP